jgi:hypothetical protein
VVKSGGDNLRLNLPKFNSLYLPAASAGVHDHIFFELKRNGSPKENEIFEIKRENKTVGFVIPGAALCSVDHSYAKNKMFGPFAYLAIWNSVMQKQENGDKPSTSLLESFIRDDRFYAVINCADLPVKTKDEFLDLYFPMFLDFGFFDANSNKVQLIDLEFDDEITNLKKSTILLHGEVSTNSFVRKILFDLIPYEKNPFFSFFYSWQVVEYFMQIEFAKRLKKFIEKNKSSHDIVDFRRALDKINEFSKEKNKISAVLSGMNANLCASIEQLHIKVSPPKTTDLIGDSISDDEEMEENMEYPAKLYRIRNLMFHSLATIEPFESEVRELSNLFWLYLQNKCWNRNGRPEGKIVFTIK